MTRVVHLIASRFFGGPERQIVELGRTLAPAFESIVVAFAEGGRGQVLLDEVRRAGLQGCMLRRDTPRLFGAYHELTRLLRTLGAEVLCCHGYKANLLGLLAARRLRIPAVAVSRGWTGESRRVRLYEKLDRVLLHHMDQIVCVSEGQAEKVRAAGVPSHKITVIYNAVRMDRFVRPLGGYRARLEHLFPELPARIVGSAGRLSREKGFRHLIAAAAQVLRARADVGFVIFGDGPEREALRRQIAAAGLEWSIVLAGFTAELDQYLPHFDAVVLPSLTEGLPNVVLEAFAAGVPVVATEVGGNPEVVEDEASGYLVPPGDSDSLARRILDLLASDARREAMGRRGQWCVQKHFSFAAQAQAYQRLLEGQVTPA